MRNREYTEAVREGDYPDSVGVPLDDKFVDGRGEILNVILSPITSVARISSKRGSVRANHRHRTDWHYAIVESGEVLYFERPTGSADIGEPVSFKAGEMFFTRPGVEHAMLFAEDTVIYTFARNVRDHESHEADLERVTFVTPEIARRFVKP